VKGVIAIVLLVGAISLTGPASSHHSDADRYHFVLPLSLTLEAACEADASAPNKDIALGPIFSVDTSGAFFELVKTNPDARHLAAVSNVMALPRAVAFKAKKVIVAALRVSGAAGEDKDEVSSTIGSETGTS
jgi:hypothetical protein